MNIRDEIVAKRKNRIAVHGHTQGVPVPEKRQCPLVPFGSDPFLIAEVKRRSPSRGAIDGNADPVKQAGIYRNAGVKTISVLTEEEYFKGSLGDLIRIKKAHPDLALLRKDFLVDETDIDVSFRAGADAVLLIASVLSQDELVCLFKRAEGLGMAVLVEVHDEADVSKARDLKPAFTGINSRNLETFAVDALVPLKVRRFIDWPVRLVYESGIFIKEEAAFALTSGFDGLLVGEALMRDPQCAAELLEAFGVTASNFWARLCRRMGRRPLVKICGITSRDDALCALDCGADILGFVLAPSRRRVDPGFVETLEDLDVLKAGVVVAGPDAKIPYEIKRLLDQQLLHAVQFHGQEAPETCFANAFPYYKAVGLQGTQDISSLERFHCPRVLIDAFDSVLAGGTGRAIPADLVESARAKRPLWLAGGIGPDNVGEIVRRFRPELIDASSRIESSPGKKDHAAVKKLFSEIEFAAESL